MGIMKAYVRDGSQLNRRELEIPEPGAGEVLVHIKAAGLNPVDGKTHSTGVDGAGIISKTGAAAAGFELNERVMFHASLKAMREGRPVGAFAEFALVSAAALVRIPGSLSFEQAATIPCPGGTAVQIRDRLRSLPVDPPASGEKQRIVIRGAAGAVGTFLVQLLLIDRSDRHIIAVASGSSEKYLKELGAAVVIPYDSGEAVVMDRLKQLGPIDAVVNLAGSLGAAHDAELITNSGSLVSVIGRPDFIKQPYTLAPEVIEQLGKDPWSDAIVRPAFSSPLVVAEIALGSAYNTGDRDVRRMAYCYAQAAELAATGSILLPEFKTIEFSEIPEALFGRRKGKFVAVL